MSKFIGVILQSKSEIFERKMKKPLLKKAVLTGLFISLGACNGANDQHSVDSAVAGSELTDPPEQIDVPLPMNLNGQIAFAKKKLAQRLGIEPGSVKLAGAEAVTWRSGALGCPAPGMAYTEALVPGSAIFLQVGNVTHAYHAKFAGEPFYCPRERVESPVLEEGVDHT